MLLLFGIWPISLFVFFFQFLCVVVGVVCRVGCVFKIFVDASKIWLLPRTSPPQDPSSPGPPSPEPQNPQNRPKFRSFFPLPPQFSLFLPSLACPFVEFLVEFWKIGTLKCSRLGSRAVV